MRATWVCECLDLNTRILIVVKTKELIRCIVKKFCIVNFFSLKDSMMPIDTFTFASMMNRNMFCVRYIKIIGYGGRFRRPHPLRVVGQAIIKVKVRSWEITNHLVTDRGVY